MIIFINIKEIILFSGAIPRTFSSFADRHLLGATVGSAGGVPQRTKKAAFLL